MKKVLGILVVFMFSLMTFSSCEEPEPPRLQCEIDNVGTAKIKNSTGFKLWVDCTKTSSGINYEKKLSNGSSYTYTMDAGKIYIWASFNGDDWAYDTYYLTACEDLTYTWYYDKKKSASDNWWENYEIVYVDQEGKEIHRTELTHFGKRDL